MQNQLIRFLTEDIGISTAQIKLALSKIPQNPDQLPMMLWQYGLINLVQLDQIFDWLGTV